MSEGILGHISKGRVHTCVDAYVNHKNAAGQYDFRQGFLAAVKRATDATQYLQLLQTPSPGGAGLSPTDATYLADTWYNPKVYWPKLQPIYAVLQAGLIKALEEAGQTLLLDSYWFPIAADPEVVEVVIMKSALQVTRVIVTPASPMLAQPHPRTMDASMWVVGAQTSPPVGVGTTMIDAIVEAVQGNVVTWRRREFP